MVFGFKCFGVRVQCVGFRVSGVECSGLMGFGDRVQYVRFGVSDLVLRVQGFGVGVQNVGFGFHNRSARTCPASSFAAFTCLVQRFGFIFEG